MSEIKQTKYFKTLTLLYSVKQTNSVKTHITRAKKLRNAKKNAIKTNHGTHKSLKSTQISIKSKVKRLETEVKREKMKQINFCKYNTKNVGYLFHLWHILLVFVVLSIQHMSAILSSYTDFFRNDNKLVNST